jgi:hypothetical protein
MKYSGTSRKLYDGHRPDIYASQARVQTLVRNYFGGYVFRRVAATTQVNLYVYRSAHVPLCGDWAVRFDAPCRKAQFRAMRGASGSRGSDHLVLTHSGCMARCRRRSALVALRERITLSQQAAAGKLVCESEVTDTAKTSDRYHVINKSQGDQQ